MSSRFLLNGTEHEIWLSRREGGYRLHDGRIEGGIEVALVSSGPASQDDRRARQETGSARVLEFAGERSPVLVAASGDDVHIHLDGRTHLVRYLDPIRHLSGDAEAGADDGSRAPMPGTVVAVHVEAGAVVSLGDALVVIESMKLETTIRATRAGIVGAVHVREGQSFERDQLLVSLAKGS